MTTGLLILLGLVAGPWHLPHPSPAGRHRIQEEMADPEAEGQVQEDVSGPGGAADAEAVVPDEVPTGGDALGRIDRALSLESLSARFERLAAEHPDLVQLDVIGQSPGGRKLLTATLTDRTAAAPESKPALLLVGQDGGPGTHGGELTTLTAERLVEGAATEPELAELLRRVTIYVVPALDPDGRDPNDETPSGKGSDGRGPDGGSPWKGSPWKGSLRDVSLDRNFPIGWSPGSVRRGGGPFPLARPEALALVRFLAGRSNVALLVRCGGRRESLPGGVSRFELPEADRRSFSRLRELGRAEGVDLLPWSESGGATGRLADYAYLALGVYPVELVEPAALVEGDELFDWLSLSSQALLGLGRALPRLDVQVDAVERFGPELWQLDLRIENLSSMPTASTLAGERRLPTSLLIHLRGLDVVATARREADETAYRVTAPGVLRETSLPAGGTIWVRVLVKGTGGQELEVEAIAPRAGRTAFSTALP